MAPIPRAVINLAPQHKFKGLKDWPEAQLLLQMPRVLWNRTRTYVPFFEAVGLAGRFGADQGDYEWEVIAEPQGFKWWRRTLTGDAAYCAFIVAPDTSTDPIEIFGLIDIASNTPWWFDAVEDAVRIETRGEVYSRQTGMNEQAGRIFISIRDEYRPRRLINAESDENGVAWRVGSAEEVERLKDAFVGLVNRARTASLPEEVRTGTGTLSKPVTGGLSKPLTSGLPKPGTGSLPPDSQPKRSATGSLKDALGNIFKSQTDQLKPKTGNLKPGTGNLKKE
jgi:hypothetical protein